MFSKSAGGFSACQLPPKKSFGTKNQDFMESKKEQFEQYLQVSHKWCVWCLGFCFTPHPHTASFSFHIPKQLTRLLLAHLPKVSHNGAKSGTMWSVSKWFTTQPLLRRLSYYYLFYCTCPGVDKVSRIPWRGQRSKILGTADLDQLISRWYNPPGYTCKWWLHMGRDYISYVLF